MNDYERGLQHYYRLEYGRAIPFLTKALHAIKTNSSARTADVDLLDVFIPLVDCLIQQERLIEAQKYLTEVQVILKNALETGEQRPRLTEYAKMLELLRLELHFYDENKEELRLKIKHFLTEMESVHASCAPYHFKVLAVAGRFHELESRIDEALKRYHQLSFHAKRCRMPHWDFFAQYHHARLLLLKGNVHEANTLLRSILETAEAEHVVGLRPYVLMELARALFFTQSLKEANDLVERSIKEFQQQDDNIGLIQALYVQAHVLQPNPFHPIASTKQAQLMKVLDQVKRLKEQYPFRPTVEAIHQVLMARKFIYQRKITSLARAQELLERLADRFENLKPVMRFEVLELLCDVKLLEASQHEGFKNAQRLLTNINELLDQMKSLSEKTSSKIFKAKTFLYQARKYLLLLDFHMVYDFLEQARKIALDTGIEGVLKDVLEFHDQLNAILTSLEIRTTKNLNDYQLDNVDLEFIKSELKTMYVQQSSLNTQSSFIEENDEPLFILIATASGLSIYFKHISRAITMNDQFLAGLLSVISVLGSSAADREINTEIINYQGRKILVMQDNKILYCYAYIGSSYSAMRKVQLLIDTINQDPVLVEAFQRDITRLTSKEELVVDELIWNIFGF